MQKTELKKSYTTEQEKHWAGEFGNHYIERNQDERLVLSNLLLFSKILKLMPTIGSIVELGCNIGLNLKALQTINPAFDLCGYEINQTAVQRARELKQVEIIHGTILNQLSTKKRFDLSFTKGVLIHIHPEALDKVYDNLFHLSSRYVLVCEYYNPKPEVIEYRGNSNLLFRRDFAGELMDRYPLQLLDYGFVYHRDSYFPMDDPTWFLLEKTQYER
ncbi:MAG: methyltransferase domain-containing protein [Legionella sp.]|nr:methyltransferase domain-containing protein [Legionella sp.]